MHYSRLDNMQQPHDDLTFSVSPREFSRMLCLSCRRWLPGTRFYSFLRQYHKSGFLKLRHLSVLYGKREAVHYFILIQGLPGNGSFKWINPYKYRNPIISSITVLFRPNQVMVNSVDSTNVIKNTNGRGCDNSSLLLHAR